MTITIPKSFVPPEDTPIDYNKLANQFTNSFGKFFTKSKEPESTGLATKIQQRIQKGIPGIDLTGNIPVISGLSDAFTKVASEVVTGEGTGLVKAGAGIDYLLSQTAGRLGTGLGTIALGEGFEKGFKSEPVANPIYKKLDKSLVGNYYETGGRDNGDMVVDVAFALIPGGAVGSTVNKLVGKPILKIGEKTISKPLVSMLAKTGAKDVLEVAGLGLKGTLDDVSLGLTKYITESKLGKLPLTKLAGTRAEKLASKMGIEEISTKTLGNLSETGLNLLKKGVLEGLEEIKVSAPFIAGLTGISVAPFFTQKIDDRLGTNITPVATGISELTNKSIVAQNLKGMLNSIVGMSVANKGLAKALAVPQFGKELVKANFGPAGLTENILENTPDYLTTLLTQGKDEFWKQLKDPEVFLENFLIYGNMPGGSAKKIPKEQREGIKEIINSITTEEEFNARMKELSNAPQEVRDKFLIKDENGNLTNVVDRAKVFSYGVGFTNGDNTIDENLVASKLYEADKGVPPATQEELEAFKSEITQPAFKEGIAQEQNIEVKKDVEDVFSKIPELSNYGNVENYQEYVNSIFPESELKEVLKHTSKAKFSEFKKGSGRLGKGIYLASGDYKMYDKAGDNTYYTVVNVGNTKRYDNGEFNIEANKEFPSEDEYSAEPQTQLQERDKREGVDSYVSTSKSGTEYNIFEPEQIHILGNQKDIEGFKNFTKNKQTTQSVPTITQEQKQEIITNISKILEPLGIKAEDTIEFVETIAENPNALGMFKDNLIKIVEGQTFGEAGKTAMHEAFHLAFSLLPKEQKLNISNVVINSKEFKEWKTGKEKPENILIEEFLAEKFEGKKVPAQSRNILQKTWNKIKTFFSKLVGRFDEIEGLFDRILQGEIKPVISEVVPTQPLFRTPKTKPQQDKQEAETLAKNTNTITEVDKNAEIKQKETEETRAIDEAIANTDNQVRKIVLQDAKDSLSNKDKFLDVENLNGETFKVIPSLFQLSRISDELKKENAFGFTSKVEEFAENFNPDLLDKLQIANVEGLGRVLISGHNRLGAILKKGKNNRKKVEGKDIFEDLGTLSLEDAIKKSIETNFTLSRGLTSGDFYGLGLAKSMGLLPQSVENTLSQSSFVQTLNKVKGVSALFDFFSSSEEGTNFLLGKTLQGMQSLRTNLSTIVENQRDTEALANITSIMQGLDVETRNTILANIIPVFESNISELKPISIADFLTKKRVENLSYFDIIKNGINATKSQGLFGEQIDKIPEFEYLKAKGTERTKWKKILNKGKEPPKAKAKKVEYASEGVPISELIDWAGKVGATIKETKLRETFNERINTLKEKFDFTQKVDKGVEELRRKQLKREGQFTTAKAIDDERAKAKAELEKTIQDKEKEIKDKTDKLKDKLGRQKNKLQNEIYKLQATLEVEKRWLKAGFDAKLNEQKTKDQAKYNELNFRKKLLEEELKLTKQFSKEDLAKKREELRIIVKDLKDKAKSDLKAEKLISKDKLEALKKVFADKARNAKTKKELGEAFDDAERAIKDLTSNRFFVDEWIDYLEQNIPIIKDRKKLEEIVRDVAGDLSVSDLIANRTKLQNDILLEYFKQELKDGTVNLADIPKPLRDFFEPTKTEFIDVNTKVNIKTERDFKNVSFTQNDKKQAFFDKLKNGETLLKEDFYDEEGNHFIPEVGVRNQKEWLFEINFVDAVNNLLARGNAGDPDAIYYANVLKEELADRILGESGRAIPTLESQLKTKGIYFIATEGVFLTQSDFVNGLKPAPTINAGLNSARNFTNNITLDFATLGNQVSDIIRMDSYLGSVIRKIEGKQAQFTLANENYMNSDVYKNFMAQKDTEQKNYIPISYLMRILGFEKDGQIYGNGKERQKFYSNEYAETLKAQDLQVEKDNITLADEMGMSGSTIEQLYDSLPVEQQKKTGIDLGNDKDEVVKNLRDGINKATRELIAEKVATLRTLEMFQNIPDKTIKDLEDLVNLDKETNPLTADEKISIASFLAQYDINNPIADELGTNAEILVEDIKDLLDSEGISELSKRVKKSILLAINGEKGEITIKDIITQIGEMENLVSTSNLPEKDATLFMLSTIKQNLKKGEVINFVKGNQIEKLTEANLAYRELENALKDQVRKIAKETNGAETLANVGVIYEEINALPVIRIISDRVYNGNVLDVQKNIDDINANFDKLGDKLKFLDDLRKKSSKELSTESSDYFNFQERFKRIFKNINDTTFKETFKKDEIIKKELTSEKLQQLLVAMRADVKFRKSDWKPLDIKAKRTLNILVSVLPKQMLTSAVRNLQDGTMSRGNGFDKDLRYGDLYENAKGRIGQNKVEGFKNTSDIAKEKEARNDIINTTTFEFKQKYLDLLKRLDDVRTSKDYIPTNEDTIDLINTILNELNNEMMKDIFAVENISDGKYTGTDNPTKLKDLNDAKDLYVNGIAGSVPSGNQFWSGLFDVSKNFLQDYYNTEISSPSGSQYVPTTLGRLLEGSEVSMPTSANMGVGQTGSSFSSSGALQFPFSMTIAFVNRPAEYNVDNWRKTTSVSGVWNIAVDARTAINNVKNAPNARNFDKTGLENTEGKLDTLENNALNSAAQTDNELNYAQKIAGITSGTIARNSQFRWAMNNLWTPLYSLSYPAYSFMKGEISLSDAVAIDLRMVGDFVKMHWLGETFGMKFEYDDFWNTINSVIFDSRKKHLTWTDQLFKGAKDRIDIAFNKRGTNPMYKRIWNGLVGLSVSFPNALISNAIDFTSFFADRVAVTMAYHLISQKIRTYEKKLGRKLSDKEMRDLLNDYSILGFSKKDSKSALIGESLDIISAVANPPMEKTIQAKGTFKYQLLSGFFLFARSIGMNNSLTRYNNIPTQLLEFVDIIISGQRYKAVVNNTLEQDKNGKTKSSATLTFEEQSRLNLAGRKMLHIWTSLLAWALQAFIMSLFYKTARKVVKGESLSENWGDEFFKNLGQTFFGGEVAVIGALLGIDVGYPLGYIAKEVHNYGKELTGKGTPTEQKPFNPNYMIDKFGAAPLIIGFFNSLFSTTRVMKENGNDLGNKLVQDELKKSADDVLVAVGLDGTIARLLTEAVIESGSEKDYSDADKSGIDKLRYFAFGTFEKSDAPTMPIPIGALRVDGSDTNTTANVSQQNIDLGTDYSNDIITDPVKFAIASDRIKKRTALINKLKSTTNGRQRAMLKSEIDKSMKPITIEEIKIAKSKIKKPSLRKIKLSKLKFPSLKSLMA